MEKNVGPEGFQIRKPHHPALFGTEVPASDLKKLSYYEGVFFRKRRRELEQQYGEQKKEQN
jgi:hypothetical protein